MMSLPMGILLGIILAIVPGPVAVGAMKLSLNNGRKAGLLYAAGGGIMDAIFCSCAIFATSAVISAIGNFSAEHPILIFSIQILIVAGILIYGIMQFKEAKRNNRNEIEELEKSSNTLLDRVKHHGPLAIGIAISMTNVPSPTFLPGLAYFTLQVQKLHFYEITWISSLLLAIGFGIGNFLWLSAIVRAVTHYKNKFSTKFISVIYKFAGCTLLCFGTILGYRVVSITRWSEIFSFLLAF